MERLRKKLIEVKIFTVNDLSQWLSCSVVTARRRLKEWDAHTSYNCNGRYYVLPEVPRFDVNGLWRCRGAYFSMHGNLRQTVRALAAASSGGLSSREIGSMLGLDARTFLAHFEADPGLSRESSGRGHVWFAGDAPTRLRQMEERRNLQESVGGLSDSDAVVLLVEVIKNPGMDCAALARRLALSSPGITVDAAERFLIGHGLLKKKLGLPSSEC